MSKIIIPANYKPALNLYDTQRAIGTVKRLFADTLCATLNLYRVSAPLFLEASTGLNDDLNGVERKVTFDIKDSGTEAQVVQSLAKWKRQALKDYDFRVGKGLYCDMNAIRRDEELDNLHSVYVDQWDWEKIITVEDRNETYLKNVVRCIVSAVCATEMNLHAMFPQPAGAAPAHPQRDLCHHAGAGGQVPRSDPEGAGERLCQGERHHLPDEDRRTLAQRQASRRPRPGLR